MTSKEFVIWLKGFTEGVHEYNISPKQWDLMKDKLAEVDDNTIPMGGIIVDHNTFKVNDPGFYPNYPGTTSKGTFTTTPGTTGTFTTTPGTTGQITTTNPSSITYTTGSGGWSYTNNTK
jgi:hypothetical protein